MYWLESIYAIVIFTRKLTRLIKLSVNTVFYCLTSLINLQLADTNVNNLIIQLIFGE